MSETTPSAAPDRAAGIRSAALFEPILEADRAAEAAAGIGAELARFGAARLHAAVEAQQALLGCHSASAAMEVQARYLGSAARDYAEEWERLGRLGLGLAVPRLDAMPLPSLKRHATPV